MRRFAVILGMVALLCGVMAGPEARVQAGPCTACGGAALSTEEQALWQEIVAARAAAGLMPLTLDSTTTLLARARSGDMATHHLFGHISSAGTTFLDMMPDYGLTGELASETIQRNNYADSPHEAARGLIASPEHHAILFDNRYRTAGVGSAVGDDGIHYFTIIVIQPL